MTELATDFFTIGNDTLSAETAGLDSLPKKEREFYIVRATEILANSLYEQDMRAKLDRDCAEIQKTERQAAEQAAIESRCAYLSGLNLKTTEGRVRFFVAIGGHITMLNEHGQSIGDSFTGAEQTLAVSRKRGYTGAMKVTLEKSCGVIVIGDTSAIGLPPTTTAVLNGVLHSFYSSQSMTRALSFNSSALSFRWECDVRPEDDFTALVIDPATGNLPAVGPKIDRYLRECDTKPDLFFELIGAK